MQSDTYVDLSTLKPVVLDPIGAAPLSELVRVFEQFLDDDARRKLEKLGYTSIEVWRAFLLPLLSLRDQGLEQLHIGRILRVIRNREELIQLSNDTRIALSDREPLQRIIANEELRLLLATLPAWMLGRA